MSIDAHEAFRGASGVNAQVGCESSGATGFQVGLRAGFRACGKGHPRSPLNIVKPELMQWEPGAQQGEGW